MFSFGRKKENEEIVLILDVGSGSVAVSLVELSLQTEPTVLYIKREPIKFQHRLVNARFRREMIRSLNLALTDVNKNGLSVLGSGSKRNIQRVLCSLSSPWFVSQTKIVSIKKEKPFLITEEFISDFVREEEEIFANSHKKDYGSGEALEVFERKIIEIKLNGYKTANPFQKSASQVDISLFISVTPSDILDEIEDTITKHFYINQIDFHSFTLISYSAIRDMYDRVSNFLLLDITGEVTDISIIKKGVILKSVSFPIGKNSLIRKVLDTTKTIPEEVMSSIKLFLSGGLHQDKIKVLEKVLNKSKEEWVKGFRESLVELSSGRALPITVFFTSDEDISLWYNNAIKEDEFAQQSLAQGSFVVNFINSPSLRSYISFRSKSERDSFIAIESIFFNRIFELEG